MRLRTAAALVLVLGVAGGLAVTGLVESQQGGATLHSAWVGETASGIEGNHHAPAVGVSEGAVFVPVGGRGGSEQCGLVALDGASGATRWRYRVPPANCTIHAVADPTVADYDGDGTREVFAATTERAVLGVDPRSGAVEFRQNLTSYGYTRPLVANLTGSGRPEIVVVDVRGTASAWRPNGTAVWRKQLSSYTWGQPAVADFDGDGSGELAVGLGGGALVLLEGDGTVAWRRAPVDGSITWMATGQADDDGAVEIVPATTGGVVAVVDGRSGAVQWQRDFGAYAAVRAFGDGDGDGDPEVYVAARDGTLRSVAAGGGSVEWATTLATADVQMTPPPSLGDVDGDGSRELVAPTNTGVVSLVDPRTGEILDTYERTAPIWTHPTLADVDGDAADEAFVVYGDGRVVALSGTAGRLP